MAQMVAPGTGIDRVVQRVITRPLQRERYRLCRPVRTRAEAWVILTNDNAVSTRRSPPDAGTAMSFVKITKPYRRIQDN